jgi:hypothetical protein
MDPLGEGDDPMTALPAPVQVMIDATNRGDHDAFVASFTEDALLSDWGKEFHGHDGVASWDQTDNIGRSTHFDVAAVVHEGDAWIVTLKVSGGGFNGTSDFTFELDGDRIRRMTIAP